MKGVYKMIDPDDIIVTNKYNKEVLGWFFESINKRKKKRIKKKEITEVGAYCPKKKPGQAWSYNKDSKEIIDEDSDVA